MVWLSAYEAGSVSTSDVNVGTLVIVCVVFSVRVVVILAASVVGYVASAPSDGQSLQVPLACSDGHERTSVGSMVEVVADANSANSDRTNSGSWWLLGFRIAGMVGSKAAEMVNIVGLSYGRVVMLSTNGIVVWIADLAADGVGDVVVDNLGTSCRPCCCRMA